MGFRFPLLNSLLELLGRQLEVLFHGLTKLLPHLGFRVSDQMSRRVLCLLVTVCCLWNPTSLLQFESPFHLPQLVPATRALSSRLNNGSVEHGPLRFNAPHYLRDVVEAPLEVGVEDHFHRVLSQTFPADPHYSLGPASSLQLPVPFLTT